MALIGGSSKRTSQNVTNNTLTQTLDDIDAPVLAGIDGDVSLVYSDSGAIEGALSLGGDVIGANRDAVREIADTSQRVTENAFDFGGDLVGDTLNFGEFAVDRSLDSVDRNTGVAFDFGGEALQGIGQASGKALDFGGDALSAVGTAFDKTLSFAEDIVAKTGAQLSQTTATVTAATRSDSAATLDTFIKYGAGMMAVFFIAQVVMKKGK